MQWTQIIVDFGCCRFEWLLLCSSFLLLLVGLFRLFCCSNLPLELSDFLLLSTLGFLLFLPSPVGLFLFLTLAFDGSLSEADQCEVAWKVFS